MDFRGQENLRQKERRGEVIVEECSVGGDTSEDGGQKKQCATRGGRELAMKRRQRFPAGQESKET